MLDPEYRVGFHVLRKELGLWSSIKIGINSIFQARKIHFEPKEKNEIEMKKTRLKNHFKLLVQMYYDLKKRYGPEKTQEVMKKVLMNGGDVFMRHFKPIGPNDRLADFITIYKAFESKNLVFEVLEESQERFEIIVHRCLIYEAFRELGIESLTQWMCDIAFRYFKNYNPNIQYLKDRMIARGDETCHEVFLWKSTSEKIVNFELDIF